MQNLRRFLLCSLVLLCAACASHSGRIAGDLDSRLNMRLAAEIASGQATVQRLPDGARVTLADGTVFSVSGVTLDDKGRYTVASVIQALLAPSLLQIEIAGSSAASPGVQDAQARAVTTFFRDYGIAATAVSAAAPPDVAGQGVPVLTITIRAAPA